MFFKWKQKDTLHKHMRILGILMSSFLAHFVSMIKLSFQSCNILRLLLLSRRQYLTYHCDETGYQKQTNKKKYTTVKKI
jgi:hypothetical protein